MSSTWIGIYVVGFLVAWYLNSGMLFSSAQGQFKMIAAKYRREDAGLAIVLGCVAAFIWPIGTPLAFCMTGFAEYGVWRIPQ